MGPRGRFKARMKDVIQEAKISERYCDKTVQIDMFVCMHQAALRHAPDLVLEGRREGVVRTVLERVKWLTG